MTDFSAVDPGLSSPALAEPLRAYRASQRRRWCLVALLLALTLSAMLLDITSGPSSLRFMQALHGLWQPDSLPPSLHVVLWDLRLPVTLLAVLVGVALAVAGVEMQTVLGNPLAEPFTLGVSSAAALGASLAIVLNWGIPGLPAAWLVSGNAFIFALGALALLQLFARRPGADAQILVLFGIAIGFAAAALLSLVQFVASEDALQQLVFWSMGSLARADWLGVGLLALVIACVLPFSWRAASAMTALGLGDERARSYGIDVAHLRRWALLRISLLAAVAVALAGTIGFVGLVGPHVARLLVGDGHRHLLPAAALVGALLMVLASVVSKSIVPGVLLPVGIITALVGLPVFVLLVLRRTRGAA